MKKTAIILAFLFLLNLCSACSSQSAGTDVGGSISAAEASTAAEETSSEVPDGSQTEAPEADTPSEPEEAVTEAAGPEIFSWKGYSMTFPFMTVDMAGYGVDDFQGSIVLVRLAPVEGTIAYDDFKQNLFELVDPEGNTHSCKFFIVADTISSPVMEGMPADEQSYIEMLFEMSDATAEELAASHVNVYEEEDSQPLEVPLQAVSQELPK